MADALTRRCAIYTRTSSDEGLAQDYNSLAAQRDACAAFILSQKHEGWVRSRKAYDDGGFSGGSLERPALADLLSDVAAGEVDIIVIYKIDRLTRSLRDFAKLSEILENNKASFVAVTQQFNTASSMGRLTLNILLTFAQFEREVAGDRIRDKRASSTRIGIWMGGNPALGYDAPAKKLIVNPREAGVIRHIYRRFLELRSMAELRKDMQKSGVVSKQRIMKDGRVYGGVPFTWHPLHRILTNPLYAGMIRHKQKVYNGRHEAIIDRPLFDAVQTLAKEVSASEKMRRAKAYPSLLRGIIFDISGEPLYTHHTVKNGRKYNYYISMSLASRRHRRDGATRIRVSAPAIDKFIISELAARFRDREWVGENVASGRMSLATFRNSKALADDLDRQLVKNTGTVRKLLRHIALSKNTIHLIFSRPWLTQRLDLISSRMGTALAVTPLEASIEGHPIRCGNEVKNVLESADGRVEPDHRLVQEILRAIRWFNALSSGRFATVLDLAKAESCSPTLISDRIRLAFLAPDIVEAIIEGRQPQSMTTARLKRCCPLPMSWEEQRTLLLR
ncbi:recombinase family protein [Aestuariivirga sp.]|uniref:recombinase family protein n=1 Tax=Aestuariivirga sp. TaxID=2650926 RepID=UPI003BA8807B